MRVGFLGNHSKEWMGGVNYIKNLLFAIQANNQANNQVEKKVIPIVFVGRDTDIDIRKSFSPFAQVIEVPVLTRKSFHWWIWRGTKKIFKTDLWLELLLRKYKIDVFSHSDMYPFFARAVNWIPDFQHLHLPHLFSAAEVAFRGKSFKRAAKYANLVILSSQDALNDLKGFAPEYADKGRVLNFVAQPNRQLLGSSPREEETLVKYSISGKFFYLPNQFWKHKNHKIVFEALALLKAKGVLISLVCSGRMSDYRDESFFPGLKAFVENHQLNVKFLGLIDYDEVILLMKKSLAVINPSLFEGWSSTVEECKAIGKNLILSDIPVHREQNPAGAEYFDPTNALLLSELMIQIWEAPQVPVLQKMDLEKATLDFAQKYAAILAECFSDFVSDSGEKRRL